MTLERIEELRRSIGTFKPSAEMTELLDAAEAWELYRKDHVCERPCWWIYKHSRLWVTLIQGDHPTPQAAVLAALRTKGGRDEGS